MREQFVRVGVILISLLGLPKMALPQAAQQSGTLIVKGHSGHTPVIQINGASYVDIEALARLVNGSLGFQGNQITLTLPGASSASTSAASTSATAPPPSETTNTGFSKDFLKAGIEEMSLIREWRSAMTSAVKNGYPLTDAFVANYRNQAATSLRLVSVAVSTDADRNAFPLLSNEFDKMQKLSNKILAARKDMNYISPDALQNDPLDQQILACARSLAAMAAANQFQDDGSCY
jgi:hypothetical protein